MKRGVGRQGDDEASNMEPSPVLMDHSSTVGHTQGLHFQNAFTQSRICKHIGAALIVHFH